MIKIYLNVRFLTQRITGVQRFAFELCKALDNLLMDVNDLQIIGLMPNREINAQYTDYVFHNIIIKSCGRFTGHIWEQFELPFYSQGSLLMNLCNTAPLLKFKQIITLHDVIFMTNLDSQKWWFKAWYQLIARVTVLSAKFVFTVSEFSKAEIVRLLAVEPEKIVVLGNAASIQNYPYDDSILDRFNLRDQQHFLMIGSNSARKNTQMVAKLFASDPKLSKATLVIVGGKYVNLGLVDDIVAENLIYTDYITDGELRSLYTNADALIFPSLYEGFGIPLVEAMAESLPILAADIPVTREVCAVSALYFSATDRQQLANCILLLKTQPELRERLIKSGLQQLGNYQWVRFAKIMLAKLMLETKEKE
ncbi:MAG: glycosyltransferase family 4 protein [Sphingobacteriaceae bacterium]|nr:glycosyltransferase family 4 protein [Sphingobacteriaceae bacterium]